MYTIAVSYHEWFAKYPNPDFANNLSLLHLKHGWRTFLCHREYCRQSRASNPWPSYYKPDAQSVNRVVEFQMNVYNKDNRRSLIKMKKSNVLMSVWKATLSCVRKGKKQFTSMPTCASFYFYLPSTLHFLLSFYFGALWYILCWCAERKHQKQTETETLRCFTGSTFKIFSWHYVSLWYSWIAYS